MLFSLMRSGFTPQNLIILGFSYAIILIIAFPIHECAHALVAKLLGDDTAERQGRITLNPMMHLDTVGTISMLILGIGWAKPVPVNPTRCRKVSARAAMALTAAAGPVSNVIVSLVFLIIAKVCIVTMGTLDTTAFYIIQALLQICQINLFLGVFNLIPIPPFDGSRILLVFLKEKTYFKIMQYERYIMIGVLMLCWTGILSIPINFVSNAIYSFLDMITKFIC